METKQKQKPKINPQSDPLDLLVESDPKRVIALMLWKHRRHQPDLFVQITPEDIHGFDQCVAYLEVTPDVLIHRPEGAPAREAMPPIKGRPGVPAKPADPPKPYVIVQLIEKGTANAFRPVENNQTDYDAANDAQEVRRARDQAPALAERIVQQAQSGETSLSDIQDAANALIILARSFQA